MHENAGKERELFCKNTRNQMKFNFCMLVYNKLWMPFSIYTGHFKLFSQAVSPWSTVLTITTSTFYGSLQLTTISTSLFQHLVSSTLFSVFSLTTYKASTFSLASYTWFSFSFKFPLLFHLSFFCFRSRDQNTIHLCLWSKNMYIHLLTWFAAAWIFKQLAANKNMFVNGDISKSVC